MDVGALFLDSNYFAHVVLSVQRPSDASDTIYFDMVGPNQFRKKIVGPFINGQIIDSIVYRNSQVYDLNGLQKYLHRSPAYYAWKEGLSGKVTNVWDVHTPCQHNLFTLTIK